MDEDYDPSKPDDQQAPMIVEEDQREEEQPIDIMDELSGSDEEGY